MKIIEDSFERCPPYFCGRTETKSGNSLRKEFQDFLFDSYLQARGKIIKILFDHIFVNHYSLVLDQCNIILCEV